ncbi:MAG TPA: acetolactate synthase [Bacillus bacterium]|uniref:Thiamine pyrophosphate protein n=1 Tax=Siminovitchia fordii TaxID=254759 RepID=A0ABQ4K1D0_9BACI|nr:thiamine pyrophosphate-dependent enzyme [Siminovitchia fordii]GIN19567.1 thiamine pyrophosphate protein [Siminovitchia fordii]HBZ11524.1 acetolactate synthase [Bacillus sp. (in: firmicutes)]
MKKLSGGHIVVEVLEKEGVEKAFCVPGESYLGVIDGLYEHSTIDLISTRHEGGASFMAEAYAKASGKVGVCMATRGPGATNLSIGLHTAMQDSTPLVALIGQVERPFKGKEAFQEVDFAAYFSHLCKWAVEIDSAERISEVLHRAFYIARSGRPGPVVVSLPHDMLEDVIDYHEGTVAEVEQPEASDAAVEKVLAKLSSAKQPIIIAGGGVMAANAQEELARFAEMVKVPVASAFRRFNVLSNDHPNYAGWLGFGSDSELIKYIDAADLVFAIGTRFSQVTTQDYTLLNEKTELIQVDISPDSIGKAYPAAFGVVSDAKRFLQKAFELAKPVQEESREKAVQTCHKAYLDSSTPPVSFASSEFAELNAVMADIVVEVPENSILTSDAGNFYGWLAKYFRFTNEKEYIGPTSGAMGYGLPAAIGAKAACPDKTVISFSGDGGFMMTMVELETAVRANLPVIAIVINNNMYGTIRAHQEKHFPNRIMATPLTNPNFAAVAKQFGCEGETVRKNEEFLPVFKRALQCDKPFVIEIQTDPNILSAAQAAK